MAAEASTDLLRSHAEENPMSATPDMLHRNESSAGGAMPPEETPFAALLSVMPAHDGADEQVDWDAMRRAWGVGFPSDYTAFMATYGAGGIDAAFSVLTPEATAQPPDGSGFGSMAGETTLMRHIWATEGGPDGVSASPDSVIAWGGSCGADTLGWITVDEDPDKWPVIVCWTTLSMSRNQWLGDAHD
ncbi:hypothetical protein ACFWXG_19235, partial [Streptomyces sp. NPDC059072]